MSNETTATFQADMQAPGSNDHGVNSVAGDSLAWVFITPASAACTGFSVLPWGRVSPTSPWLPLADQAYTVAFAAGSTLATHQLARTDIRPITVRGLRDLYVQAYGITGGDITMTVQTQHGSGSVNMPDEGTASLDFSLTTNSQYFILGYP
ncbi:MAG TPA: hypothetical protein VMY39_00095 [Planctomycetota bacterium]|nr:hypothetical protein [Planctomycetota bacterium]